MDNGYVTAARAKAMRGRARLGALIYCKDLRLYYIVITSIKLFKLI